MSDAINNAIVAMEIAIDLLQPHARHTQKLLKESIESLQALQSGEPVAWLRFRQAMVAVDDCVEWLEPCNQGDVGDDGSPAFSVYTTPQPVVPDISQLLDDDDFIFRVDSRAREQFRRHQSSVRGQQTTRGDNYHWHIMAATLDEFKALLSAGKETV